MKYDIAVIGNDEAAFEILNLAAASGHKTIALLPDMRQSAWLVSQALRQLTSGLLVDLSSRRSRMLQRSATPKLLKSLLSRAIVTEVQHHVSALDQLGIDVRVGEPQLTNGRSGSEGPQIICNGRILSPQNLVIATGVRRCTMHRPVGRIPFHSPDALFAGRRLPESVTIIGGGEFGAGIATLLSIFGSAVRLVTRDQESSVMLELAASAGVEIGSHPAEFGLNESSDSRSVRSGDVVDCRRSVGYTDHLGLETINVEPDEKGQLWCASSFETWPSGVFGIGEVVGFSPDTALCPTAQAERIMRRISTSIPRPHLHRQFVTAAC